VEKTSKTGPLVNLKEKKSVERDRGSRFKFFRLGKSVKPAIGDKSGWEKREHGRGKRSKKASVPQREKKEKPGGTKWQEEVMGKGPPRGTPPPKNPEKRLRDWVGIRQAKKNKVGDHPPGEART